MAKLQRTFKESYVKTLRDQVTMGLSIRQYAEEKFEYDPSMVRAVANVYQPEGLLEKLDTRDPRKFPEADYNTAIEIYEAYKNLPPIVASNEAFWIYLTHVDLFPYVQKRYPKVGTKDGGAKYILAHWFRNEKFIRTTLCGLWWSVYCTVDESRGTEHQYDLTKLLFTNYKVRVDRLGSSTLFRHREAMIGILSFFYDNPELIDEAWSPRGAFVIVHFNRLGATKELSYLDRHFFYQECEKLIPKLKTITSLEEITNNDEIYDI